MAAFAGLGAGLWHCLPAHAATARHVLPDCGGKVAVRPASYTPFCADNGFGLEKMHWTSWTAQAAGSGIAYEDDNYPDHAQGHIYRVPAVVTLSGATQVNGHPGELRYTELTVTYPAARPAVLTLVSGRLVLTHPASQTFRL